MSRSYALRLADMVECCERVLGYTKALSLPDFVADTRTFDAVLRNLEILGEAAKHIPQPFRDAHPEVEWRRIAALRDVLSHGYFGLDNETLWDVVTAKIPELLPRLRAILRSEGGSKTP